MAARETRALSNPIVFLDGRRIKIVPNSCTAELPGEVKSRAVSAGGNSVNLVHGYDVESSVCKIKFDVANTAEMVELAADYKDRAKRIDTSTLRLVEDTAQFSYDEAVLSNRIEIGYSADGKIPFEFMGRLSAI